MSKREFIRKNRAEIDRVIRSKLGNDYGPINDGEREMWLLNDEGLYNWARGAGVKSL